MRPTLPRLVRVIPRSQLASENSSAAVIQPLRPPKRSDIEKPTLIDELLKRKAQMGDKYPSNIRIEPMLPKSTFKGVPAETRDELRELLKER